MTVQSKSIAKRPNTETPWLPIDRTENSWYMTNQHFTDVWYEQGRLLSSHNIYNEDQLTVTTIREFIDIEALIDFQNDDMLTEVRLQRDTYLEQAGIEVISTEIIES
jgi:hypothetical protein